MQCRYFCPHPAGWGDMLVLCEKNNHKQVVSFECKLFHVAGKERRRGTHLHPRFFWFLSCFCTIVESNYLFGVWERNQGYPFPPLPEDQFCQRPQEAASGPGRKNRIRERAQSLGWITMSFSTDSFYSFIQKKNMHSLELYYKYDRRLSFLTVHLGNLLMSIYPIDDIKLDPKFQKGHALIFFSSFRSSDLALLISSFNNAWSFLDVNFAQQKCQERLFLMHFFLPLTWCITMTWNVHFIVANFLQYTTLQMWT